MEEHKKKRTKYSQEYLICFMDILGSKEKLSILNQDAFIDELDTIYKDATELALKASSSVNGYKKTRKHQIKTKIFSDNILIAMKFSGFNNKEEETLTLNMFISFISLIQYKCLRRRLLVRGGITVGNLYFDETFAIGSGLIDAYQLENKVAVYPRIITDNADLVSKINDIQHLDVKFIKDVDDFYYLDFLNAFGLNKVPDICKTELYFISETWTELFAAQKPQKTKPQIIQKQNWFKNYFNNFCDLHNCSNLKF